MKTDFEKYRRLMWMARGGVVALGIVFVCCIVELCAGRERSHLWLAASALSLAVSLIALKAIAYTKCPHCGKSVLSKWSNVERGKRIAERRPVICVRCGEEVDTD